MTGVLPLSLRLLRRALRAGELRLLVAAVALAVTAVTAVGFFADRVARVLESQANELLGADLVVVSESAPSSRWTAHARSLGLRTSQTVTFPSMVLGDQGGQLAEIKAVSAGYPLRGRIETRPVTPPGSIPAPGTVWLEPRLRQALGLQVGDPVTVGALGARIAAEITVEPDRGGDFFNIAPRLMMNLDDIPASELVQPASRVRYRLLVAGQPPALNAFRDWLAPRLAQGQRLRGVEDARPGVRTALERARQFLGVAALGAVLLGAVAVLLAARRYARRRLDDAAMLRCLGATQGLIVRIFALQLLVLGTLASALGVVAGLAAQGVLASLLGSMVAAPLPAPTLKPALLGSLVGVATLLGFALPPVLALRDTPTLRVLRRDLGGVPAPGILAYAGGLAAIAGLMAYQAGEARLACYLIGGSAATLVALLLAARVVIAGVRLVRGGAGVAWRWGLANIARRSTASAVQVAAFGLGIMALLLLTLVRTDLIHEWRQRLPPDAPNRFIINIQPDQRAALGDFFRRRSQPSPVFYPMVRGRLVAVNGHAVSPEDFPEGRPRRLVARAFNLSWAARPAPDNRIVAGRWWTEQHGAGGQFSVEQGLAKSLGIALGDLLTFRIGGDTVHGRVASLREVDWDSFRANFFVIASPGLLDGFPVSYITSFYLPQGLDALLNEAVHTFPNLTIIDVASIMARVRSIMDRVALAVEYVFLFTLAAGALVMYAAILATRDERLRESAVLRALGASRRQLAAGVIAEFAVLGLLSGVVGAAGAAGVAQILATQVLDLPHGTSVWLWLLGPLGGAVGVAAAGWVGTRSLVMRPPLGVLREG